MKIYFRNLFLFILIASLGFSNARIGLAPLYVRLAPEQGAPSQTIFTVINGSNEPVRFRAMFSPFSFKGTIIQYESASESDLSPYLRAAPLEFEVPAFSEQAIRVVALVPPSLLQSELRAALVLEPLLDATPTQQNSGEERTGQALFTYQFVAQMFLGQPGTITLDVDTVRYGKNNLQMVMSNSGTTSGISNVSWELAKGNEEITSSKDAARFVVLTQGKRTYNLAPGLNLTPGTYTLTGTFGAEDGGEPPVVLNPQPFTKTFTVK